MDGGILANSRLAVMFSPKLPHSMMKSKFLPWDWRALRSFHNGNLSFGNPI